MTERGLDTENHAIHSGEMIEPRAGTDYYYSCEMLKHVRYAMPYPNAEESQRAGAILGYVGLIAERYSSNETQPHILDVGCGRGWLANLLGVFGPTTGIDPASGAIERAKALFPAVQFHHGLLSDLLQLPSFQPVDLVVCSEVLEHVEREQQERFMENLYQTLKPDGWAVLTTPRREILRAYTKATGGPGQPVEEWLSERQLRKLVRRCGFAVVDQTRVRPRPLGFLGRIALSSKLRRLLVWLRLAPIRAALEYHHCHYQVLLIRKNSKRGGYAAPYHQT